MTTIRNGRRSRSTTIVSQSRCRPEASPKIGLGPSVTTVKKYVPPRHVIPPIIRDARRHQIGAAGLADSTHPTRSSGVVDREGRLIAVGVIERGNT